MKTTFRNSLILACSISIFIVIELTYSCKDDEVSPSLNSIYISYFPLEKGFWIEYSVDSIVHLTDDDSYGMDTAIIQNHFLVRDEVDSSFVDATGDLTYIISRYARQNDTLDWDFNTRGTAKHTWNAAERVEDNIRYVKLSFPVSDRAAWNGNAYNDFPEEEYRYSELYSAKTIGTMSFDSTLTVIQNDFVSNINRVNKKEVYANHVGMVYKQRDSLNTAQLPGSVTLILNGIEFEMTVTGYKH